MFGDYAIIYQAQKPRIIQAKKYQTSKKRETLDKYCPIHKYVNYKIPDAPESWLENYIALETKDGRPNIDIYEYYWAHHMTNQATISDIVEWLKETSSFARKFYRKRLEKLTPEKKTEFAENYQKQPRLRNLFDPNGQFHENGYLRNFGCFVRIGILVYESLKNSVFKNWPFVRMLFNLISQKLNKILVNYLGDIVVYTTMDRKARHYSVRQKILQQARQQIEGLLKNKEYGAILIAGHSLGSVIAYDTLNRLHKYPLIEKDAQEWKDAFSRIRGLITFGSPLDKITFYFREQVEKKLILGERYSITYIVSKSSL